MYLRTLGGLRLEGGNIRRPKPLLILAYLALEGSKNRRLLADLFWRDSKDPRDALSTTLRRLNSGGQVVQISGNGRVSTKVQCDASEFERSVPTVAPQAMLELYTGTFLDGLDIDVAEEVEEWLYATRERLADLHRRSHVTLASMAFDADRDSDATHHAERALDVESASPWRSEELAAIIRILRSGSSRRTSDAIREAQDLGFALERETIDSANLAPFDLPRVGTSFVGRQDELETIIGALTTAHIRLLTLHGPGGAGKSRLAIEAAVHAVEQEIAPGGVYFVPLETITDTRAVAEAIALSMRVVLAPNSSLEEQLNNFLGRRSVLLVLDNFEHLVASAPLLASILRRCPNTRLLVTSRIRLGLAEEHVVTVTGLGVAPESGERGEAVELLHERMKQQGTLARLTFDETGSEFEVCRLLHGAPLAIELAAALTRAMPLADVAQELRSDLALLVNMDRTMDTRHHSLHAMLDVSWILLDATGKRTLAQLSVFSGGFTSVAAGAVAGVDRAQLTDFLDASLLRVLPTGRYSWHPFVRDHAARKLAEQPDLRVDARARHAEYYLERIGSLGHDMLGAAAMTAASWIEEEFANLKAAWRYALEVGDFGPLGNAAWPLVHFAEMRGHDSDVATLFEEAVAALSKRTRGGVQELAYGHLMGCHAFLSFRLGRYEVARDHGSASLALLGALDQRAGFSGMWAARQGRALANVYLGKLNEGLEDVEANIAMCEAQRAEGIDDERRSRLLDVTAGTSHETLVLIAVQGGYFDRALEHLGPARRLLQPHGAYGLGYVYWNLGQALLGTGAVNEAKVELEEGLRFIKETGFQSQEGYLLHELARVHLTLGDAAKTEQYGLEALNLAVVRGDAALESAARVAYGQAALLARRNEDGRQRLALAVDVARRYSCFPMAIEALEGLAVLDAGQDKHAEAIRQLAFVKHSSLALAATVKSVSAELERLCADVPAELFNKAYNDGKAMTVDEAFEHAARGGDGHARTSVGRSSPKATK